MIRLMRYLHRSFYLVQLGRVLRRRSLSNRCQMEKSQTGIGRSNTQTSYRLRHSPFDRWA